MTNKRPSIFIIVSLILGSLPLLAQDMQSSIVFSANKMLGKTAQDSELVELSGSAHVKTNEIEIRADMIRMDGTDYRFITAEGAITGTNYESNFTFSCQKMTYDRETKLAVLQGTVVMEDPENDAIIKAEVLEYNQEIETALLQIDVELSKDESVCTATFAVYRKSQKILEMSGNPQVKRGEDVFNAHEIVFNIDTEEITLSGKVTGNVTDESAAEESAEQKSAEEEVNE